MKSTKHDPHGFLDGIKATRSKDIDEQRAIAMMMAMEEKAKKREKMITDIEEEHHEIDWEKYNKPGSLEMDGMIF